MAPPYTKRQLEDALLKANEGGDKESAKLFADELRLLSKESPAAPVGEEPTTLGREAGIVARGAIPGVTEGVASTVGGVAGGALGLFTGPAAPVVVPLLTAAGAIGGNMLASHFGDKPLQKGMDYVGLPKPQNEGEKLLESSVRVGMGAATPIGAAKTVLKKASPKIIDFLATAPKEQIATAVGSNAVAETTDSPLAGFAAGLTPTGFRIAGRRFMESGQDTAARLWQKALNIGKNNPAPVPGIDSDEVMALRKQLTNPSQGEINEDAAQTLARLKASAVGALPPESSITAPVLAGQEMQQNRARFGEIAADKANEVKAATADVATRAATAQLPTSGRTTGQISDSARGHIDELKDKTREFENTLWKPFNDIDMTVSTYPIRKKVADFAAGLSSREKNVILKELERFDGFNVTEPFREIQEARSAILSEARDAKPFERRVLNNFADAILSGISDDKSVVSAFADKTQREAWNKARAFTSERANKFSDPYIERALAEESLTGAPSETLGNILKNKGNREKYDALIKLLSPIKSVDTPELRALYDAKRAEVTKSIDDFMAKDLSTELDITQIGTPNEIRKWRQKYEDIFEKAPALKAKYGSIESAQKAAYDAINEAKNVEKAAQISEVSPFFKIQDPNNPTAIQTAFDNALKSTDQNSIKVILNEIPASNTAARAGLKNLALNAIFDGGDPRGKIQAFGGKLDDIFTDSNERAFLKKVSDTQDLLDRYKNAKPSEQSDIANVLRNNGFLVSLIGAPSTVAGAGALALTLGAGAHAVGAQPLLVSLGMGLGGMGLVGRRTMEFLFNTKRETVVEILKEATQNPALAKELSDIRSSKLPLYLAPFMAAAKVATSPEREDVQRKARGGPVRSSYIHPAISKIRSTRAESRM